MNYDDIFRQELAGFLKNRRARLAPSDVGLTSGNRRRTQGLRREEVVLRAGVGLTWYTWLEQGRDIQVSTSFLDNIARALLLNDTERTYLFALSNKRISPLLPKPAEADSEPIAKIQTVLDTIGAPAYARNSRYDVLAWNRANTRMFGDFAKIPPNNRNIIKLVFTSPYHRRAMLNWERDARLLVANLRLNYGQAFGDEGFLTLLQEMCKRSGEFRSIWSSHDVACLGEGSYYYKTRRHGKTNFTYSTLIPEIALDMRVVVYSHTS